MTAFVLRLLLRSPFQTAARILVLAASSALLGAMILFVGHSLHTMTGAAVRSVPLDWQGPVGSSAAASKLARAVLRQPGVATAAPVATAPFAGMQNRISLGTVQTGSGSILAIPPGYPAHFSTVRLLRGRLREGAVVLDQQLAATLRARVGSTVSLTARHGDRPVRLPVSGVALVASADILFQPLIPLLGPAPAQPPSNIAIVPFGTFTRRLASQLATVPPAAGASATFPGTQQGVSWQVQAQVDPVALGGSPRHAYDLANRIRNRVERELPGRVQFVDNLAEGLSGAAGDALYAEALFIMLALPGALVGLGLAYLAALGAVERDRRTLQLLRARGASRRQLLRLAGIESAVLGVCSGTLGAALALASTWALLGRSSAWPWALGVCVAVALAGAVAARVAAGRRALSGEGRPGTPLWERLYLDLAALAVSGLVYWLTARTGFSAVVNPDSNPTLSLSVYMFFAPALLWLGATLLLVRLRSRLFKRLAPARAAGRVGFLLKSAGSRRGAINRGLVLTTLLLAFAINLGVFASTYDQQSRVDARLTLGADVVVSGAIGVEDAVARVSGVTGTTPVDHTYAYVGPDLQDTFGIDAATFTRGSSLRDSYFLGGTARTLLGRLRARRDGILVSRETITDYSLHEGDLLRLRVFDQGTGRLGVVPFHVVGVVQEFPSAPRDSFMVANLTYLLRVTHEPGPNVVFAHVSGNPTAVAARVAEATAQRGTLVKDIRGQSQGAISSITAVDLRGISRIEGAYALLLAAAAMILYVVVAVAERRTELATMSALGVPARRILAFVWSEVALICVTGALLASLLGWLLAEMLVAMLRHAFDPPPDHLSVPWAYLGALGGATLAGAALATAVAAWAIRRLLLGSILRQV